MRNLNADVTAKDRCANSDSIRTSRLDDCGRWEREEPWHLTCSSTRFSKAFAPNDMTSSRTGGCCDNSTPLMDACYGELHGVPSTGCVRVQSSAIRNGGFLN